MQVPSILVVEDDPLIRRLLATAFARTELLVDTAADGAEALEHLERSEYALLVIDLMMPRMNGFELIEAMAAMERRRPFVFVLTAYDNARTGALDPKIVHAIVRKPFDLETLVGIVSECAKGWSPGAGHSVSPARSSSLPEHSRPPETPAE
jgi:two-component system cell cycle response regulator